MQKKVRVVIVDDEEPGSDYLHKLIQEFCPEVEVVAVANSIRSGIEKITLNKPDLVFLDIQMPGGTGFDILEKLGELGGLDFQVVFTTAFDNYAIKAFRFSALDYLLKPVDAEELMESIKKVAKMKIGESDLKSKFDFFINNYNNDEKFTQIALPTFDGFEIVDLKNVIRCESDGSYTKVVIEGQKNLVVSKMLKEIEELLGNGNFFRTHRSHLVNLDHVKRYLKTRGGSVITTDGEEVPIARGKKDQFIAIFNPGGSTT